MKQTFHRKVLQNYGAGKLTLLITFLCCIVSVSITLLAMSLSGRTAYGFGVSLSILIPATLVPFTTLAFLKLAERLGRSEKEREKLIAELQAALLDLKILNGLLPICSSCKKIRDDKGYWKQIEDYIQTHSGAEFSHGLCPGCREKLYPNLKQENSNNPSRSQS